MNNNIVKIKSNAVFKNSGFPEYTFSERTSINTELLDAVGLRNKVIFFLGYSKSGKTVYRKKYFNEKNEKYIVYRCNKDSTVDSLYSYIASQMNLSQMDSAQTKDSNKENQDREFKLGSPLFGGVTAGGFEEKSSELIQSRSYNKSNIDINFLCRNLKGSKLIIFLEDYHLIQKEFNDKFSEDLKHFLDDEILFVVIGIPGSPGRSFKHNPDLAGRSISFNFDFLDDAEAREIISKGEACLNVKFSEKMIDEILCHSFKNAFLIQSICLEILKINKINETSEEKVLLSDLNDVSESCKMVATNLEKDYESLTGVILKGARSQKEGKAYNQYNEILRALKKTNISEIEKGLSHTYIAKNTFDNFSNEKINEMIESNSYKSEKSLKGSIQAQITQALNYIEENLEKSSSRKILVVHDQTLFLMDIIFKFYLNWNTNLKDY